MWPQEQRLWIDLNSRFTQQISVIIIQSSATCKMSALLTYLQNGSASSGDYNSLNFVLPSLLPAKYVNICIYVEVASLICGFMPYVTGQILIILSNRDSNGIKGKLEGGLQRLHSADDVATK